MIDTEQGFPNDGWDRWAAAERRSDDRDDHARLVASRRVGIGAVLWGCRRGFDYECCGEVSLMTTPGTAGRVTPGPEYVCGRCGKELRMVLIGSRAGTFAHKDDWGNTECKPVPMRRKEQ